MFNNTFIAFGDLKKASDLYIINAVMTTSDVNRFVATNALIILNT
jgi:hypothetical protein